MAPGDVLEYTLVGKNIGSALSINTFIVDTLDPRTAYVPNSISIDFGPNSGAKTDVLGDDQAEYDAATNSIKVRVGNGADAANGVAAKMYAACADAVTSAAASAFSTALRCAFWKLALSSTIASPLELPTTPRSRSRIPTTRLRARPMKSFGSGGRAYFCLLRSC